MIRRAKILEIPEILSITAACAAHMCEQEILQWNEHYPSAKIFEQDLRRNELFVAENEGQLIGTIVISSRIDPEYTTVNWLTVTSNQLYIHRLAVHPHYQGMGYARRLMDFAEKMSRDKGCISIRLDTFSQNKRNQHFYEQRGYQRLDDIYFPKQSRDPFHCYELIL